MLTLDRDALLAALDPIARIVERRNTIPILGHVRLQAGGAQVAEGGSATQNRLMLTGTDLDLELRRIVSGDGVLPDITAPAHLLHDILRKMPKGGQVSIELPGSSSAKRGSPEEDMRMIIKSGRSRFTLNTLPAEDFPDITGGELPHRFDIAGEALAAMISTAQFAISTEETRYYLNGIYLHVPVIEGEAGPLRAVATDGHRLARVDHLGSSSPKGGSPIEIPGIIVPRKAAAEIGKMAEAAGEESVTVEVNTTKIRITAGDTVLTSKLIDGTFPDYQRVIPSGNDNLITLDRDDLAAAVDRVATISSERGRAVRLSLTPGQMRLSVSNPDVGEASEEIAADYAGAPIEVGFNARYLADILGQIEADTVLIKLADPGSPAILQAREGAPALFVLMPMRV
jgi:DNA polymerase III subunit beta